MPARSTRRPDLGNGSWFLLAFFFSVPCDSVMILCWHGLSKKNDSLLAPDYHEPDAVWEWAYDGSSGHRSLLILFAAK
jgi:hypothetical protein